MTGGGSPGVRVLEPSEKGSKKSFIQKREGLLRGAP